MTGADRGRIPFALVGVLLLVGSATLAATDDPRRPSGEPAVDVTMDRATAETRTELHDAVTTAAAAAARNPVTTRSNTTAGGVLNAATPFEDALRIRIYLAARDRLDRIRARRGGVTARASLSPTPNASALRRAKRSVQIESVGGEGRALRVRIEGITVAAARGGREIGRERYSPTVVVETPVLGVHGRVERFEERLNADLGDPGLARRLTARLYAAAWIRGYAQYGGAPIRNVVANRHIEITTNGALLEEQRAVFGRSDPAGRRAHRRAVGRVALRELASGLDSETGPDGAFESAVLSAGRRTIAEAKTGASLGDGHAGPTAGSEMEVRVNETADVAFVGMLRDGDVSTVIGDVYGADVRLRAAADRIAGHPPPQPPAPSGDGWILAESRERTTVTVDNGTGAGVAVPDGWHEFAAYGRMAEQRWGRTRVWERGNVTRTTGTSSTVHYRVGVAVHGRHAATPLAPGGPIRTVHERGAGPLDDPNLAGVRGAALDRLVAARGGPNTLARRAVETDLDTTVRRIEGEPPERLRAVVLEDLRQLREAVREVRANVTRGEVGTFGRNPPAELAARLESERSRLVDPPSEYRSVATKARVAVRNAYVERVLARLEARAEERRSRGDALDDALREVGGGSVEVLERSLAAQADPTADDPAEAGTDSRFTAIGSPPYLTLGAVGHERVPAVTPGERIHPLAARNINVFTVPHGDAADTIVDGLFTDRVSLRAAARTLRAADTVKSHGEVADRRRELRKAVASSVDGVRIGARTALAGTGVGRDEAERHRIVEAGLSEWNTTAGRALALTDGRAAEAIASAAVTGNETRRDRLAAELRVAIGDAVDSPGGRVDRDLVTATGNATRTAARELSRELVDTGIEKAGDRAKARLLDETLSELPAGLPLAPVPPHWYATANVWYVEIEGGYTRFTLRADRAGTGPDAALRYVREGRPVALDVDDDGEPERLGRTEPVSFRTRTAVVVVVPAGKGGVGDVDGNADERSEGWEERTT